MEARSLLPKQRPNFGADSHPAAQMNLREQRATVLLTTGAAVVLECCPKEKKNSAPSLRPSQSVPDLSLPNSRSKSAAEEHTTLPLSVSHSQSQKLLAVATGRSEKADSDGLPPIQESRFSPRSRNQSPPIPSFSAESSLLIRDPPGSYWRGNALTE